LSNSDSSKIKEELIYMEKLLRITKVLLIALCICYTLNVGGFRDNPVVAGDGCTRRVGSSLDICDCVGDNCGKVCSRSISVNCGGATCKKATRACE
jgi:hypothetical protein